MDIEAKLQMRAQRINEKLATEHAGVQEDFDELEGGSFGSLNKNREIAQQVQEIADRVRVLFKCTTCQAPARFRCTRNRTVPTGVFVFSHGNHTHGGTASIPELTIIPIPEDEK